jgi:hypothetical protein
MPRRRVKSPRGASKGQIIITATLLIVVIIFAVSITVYMTSTEYLMFQYDASRELILSIDSDFRRALIRILSEVTTTYNRTSEINEPRAQANRLLSMWITSAQTVYAVTSLRIEVSLDRTLLQPTTILYGHSYPDRWSYNLTKLYWYRPQSVSSVEASITIDSASGGVTGWESTHLILLNLTIDVPSIAKFYAGSKSTPTNVTFNFSLSKEEDRPVSDLTTGGTTILYFDPTAQPGVYPWKRAHIDYMTYNGGGDYTVIFTPQFYDPTDSIAIQNYWSFYYRFICVSVKDSRDIMVEGCSYSEVTYTISERAIEPYYSNDPRKQKETYLVEINPNGTALWLGAQMVGTQLPPIPPVPVKQIRVNATAMGASGTPTEVPSEVEAWKDDYSIPLTKFTEWRRRFVNGSKLVFELGFPPGISSQKVVVSWLEDADARPAAYPVQITSRDIGAFTEIANGAYTASLYARPGFSVWVNYTLQVAGVRYTLFGYDAAGSGSVISKYWLPAKMPGGNWTVVIGPVRAIAFRKSNVVMNPANRTYIYDELQHTTLITIPSGLPYFLYEFKAVWQKQVTLATDYMTLLGMRSGLSSGSLQDNLGKPINGSFATGKEEFHRDIRNSPPQTGIRTPGRWASIYGPYGGWAILASDAFMNEMGGYKDPNTFPEVWAYTSAIAYDRVMEYDSLGYPDHPRPFPMTPSLAISIRAGCLLIGGGNCSNPTTDKKIWVGDLLVQGKSAAVWEPMMYYRMFSEQLVPWISGVADLP